MTAYAKLSPGSPAVGPSTGKARATNLPNPFADWTLTQLILEHDKLWRWLCLPFAEKWPDQFAEKTERMNAIFEEIKHRRAA